MFVDLFFFKQKTAYEMRISDWSSDVCSSDLQEFLDLFGLFARAAEADVLQSDILEARDLVRQLFGQDLAQEIGEAVLGRADEIPGRGALEHGDVRRPLAVALFGHRLHDSSEERRIGKSVSVRVDLGGRRYIKHTIKCMNVTQRPI